ncbi:RING/U-box superfamily protein [Actinidia rufa]|uniref:RING-type E3 ubiquitin transferase n=1 Tax=Actinidia rufa TaxID=165716 RepID=A0A7J0FA57_9ERIC|nr:RING/U-box superfamily protein [Actinidia rufa]
MGWVFSEIKEQSSLSPPQPQYLLYQPPPPSQSTDFNFNNNVSPSILLIIIILAIIFFISGLLHLIVKFLLRPQNRDPDDLDNVTALQGQLQQLFHLHDAGVDQSFIDTLPIFNYKAIIGVKDPFDCAVCLCEFEPEDNLRWLPKCSHAFHMGCIDAWLLSHSTCPLCRANLLHDFSPNRVCSPIVLVLESGSESAGENASERDGVLGTSNSVARENSHLGFHFRDESGSSRVEFTRKSCEMEAKDEENQKPLAGVSEEKVALVKLGKFRNADGGGGEGSSNNTVDSRRCFSMGSFAYVMDENSSLKVPIRTPMKKQSIKKLSLPLTPGHRPAMSECGGYSRREFTVFEPFKSGEIHGMGNSGSNSNGNAIERSKRESFSVSKIWLRAKKEKLNPAATESSRRAFSFRFPVHRNVNLKPNNGWGSGSSRTTSEINIGRWENGREREFCCDVENQSSNMSLEAQVNPPSFARTTLLWLVGRQNKVVYLSSSSSKV